MFLRTFYAFCAGMLAGYGIVAGVESYCYMEMDEYRTAALYGIGSILNLGMALIFAKFFRHS
jgi:hypothetical protein